MTRLWQRQSGVRYLIGRGTARRMRYRPPTLTSPTTINVTNSGAASSYSLDTNTDYIINLPGSVGHSQQTALQVKGGLRFNGGRNIQIIGGAIAHNVDYMVSATASEDAADVQRCLYLVDFTGTMYLEGIEFTGDHIYEVINLDTRSSNPNAKFIMQNCRVSGPIKAILWRNTPTGGQQHDGGDFYQSWGGPKGGTYIDRTTVSATTYQGFFSQPTQYDSAAAPVETVITRSNMNYYQGTEAYPAWTATHYPYLVRTTFQSQAYMFWQSGRHVIRTEDLWLNAAPDKKIERSVWPDTTDATYPATISSDALGRYATWQNPATKIYGKVREGIPATGDYVPAGSVGIGYVSPGYGEDIA